MGNENVDDTVKRISQKVIQEIFEKIRSGELPRIPVTCEIRAKGHEREEEHVKRIQVQVVELKQLYLDAVKEVKRTKKLSDREKLEKLLKPLLALQEIVFPNWRQHYKFCDDSHIDLANELDLDNLEWPKLNPLENLAALDSVAAVRKQYEGMKYWISCSDILKTDNPCIYVSDDFWEELNDETPSEGTFSVSKIYRDWLPTLTTEKMKSKDLLNQILVCYTIKRAQNGYRDAIAALVSIYAAKAEAVAKKWTRRLIENGNKRLEEFQEDIKGDADELLFLLLGGITPEALINALTENKTATPLTNKGAGKFLMSNYLREALWFRRRGKVLQISFPALSEFPSDLVNDSVRWEFTPKRIGKFHPYFYRPSKMGPNRNLTTWLFGPKGNPMQGRFNQLFRDGVMRKYLDFGRIETSLWSQQFDQDSEENSTPRGVNLKISNRKRIELRTGYFCEECKASVLSHHQPKHRKAFLKCAEHSQVATTIKTKKRRKQAEIPCVQNPEDAEEIRTLILQTGIFKRNAERSTAIFLESLNKKKPIEIAIDNNITVRQVRNILKKVTEFYRPSKS